MTFCFPSFKLLTTVLISDPEGLTIEQVTSPGFGAALASTKNSVGDFK